MHARVRDFLRRGASAGREVPGTEDARVARDVPITLRRDSSEESPPPRTPFRDIPSSTSSAEPRGIPLKRDSTVIEVVPAKQASVTRDIPITRDVFIARDADVTRDTPVSRDIAVRMDSTFTGDANPGKDIPFTREVPVTRVSPVTVDIPVTREVPVTRVSPVTVDIPVTRDSPVTPSAVHDSDAPSFNYATPAWTGAAEGDAEADSATEDVEQDGSLVPRRLLRDEQKRCLQLQDENLRLKAVITTIQETNKRWQSFNAARQAYIQRLLSTIEEQQVQLNACLDALKTPAPPPAAKPARTAPTPAAPAPTTTVLDAEGRLKRLQGEVSDLHRRLQEAKKEHRDTVSMLQQVSTASTQPPESARPDYQSTAAATEKPPTEAARREHDKHCTEESASLAAARLRGTSPRHDPTPPLSPVAPPRPCYYDVVTDSPATPASPAATTTTPLLVEREREATQYSFNGDALHQHMQQHRGASPALSDALTPTPTPPPTLHRHTVRQHEEQHDDGYPVELSGSCSSLCSYSGPAPHISMASSSRATTPDQDVSMCSDATLDCSPPSPVQGTLTVGFTGAGLASVTAFHVRPASPAPSPAPPPAPAPAHDVHVLTRTSSRGGTSEDSARGRGRGSTTTSWWEDVWEGAVHHGAVRGRVGAAQHSRMDVTCPACGRAFPPAQQAGFLDHFEACALRQPPRTPPSPRTRRSCKVPDPD